MMKKKSHISHKIIIFKNNSVQRETLRQVNKFVKKNMPSEQDVNLQKHKMSGSLRKKQCTFMYMNSSINI